MANVRKAKGYVKEVDFGSGPVGYTLLGSVPFYNSSNIPVKLTAVVDSPGEAVFFADSKGSHETFIPARSQYNLPVSFAPHSAGNFIASLKCSFNNGTVLIGGSSSHSIAIKGVGDNSSPQKPTFTASGDELPFNARNIIIEISLRNDADYYEIHYGRTGASLSKADEYNGRAASFVLRELEFNTTYDIVVQAHNKHGYTSSDTAKKKTAIHTLKVDIGGILPNLNIFDKVLGQGSHIHFYEDVEVNVLQSSIIYCDKCNAVNERAFNKGLPYYYETTYTPSMPDLPAFSQAKPALTTGQKIMDDARHLPLAINIYGQVLGSGGVGGNGAGSNRLDSRFIIPPNLYISDNIVLSSDSTGNKPGVTGPQFLEGGDAIHIEYDCELNIHPTGKVKGGGGGGYGGGISRHSGWGGNAAGTRTGYKDKNMARSDATGGHHTGVFTPSHYHGRAGDSKNKDLMNWVNGSGITTSSLDSIWNKIDHTAAGVADDDAQSPHDHVDFFTGTETTWGGRWKGGSAQGSIDPDTGKAAGTDKGSGLDSNKTHFLGGGGGAGGQGFAAGLGGKAGNTSLSNIRSITTGNEGGNVAYGHLGQVLDGSFPTQRGDNATAYAPGGPSGHYKSPLYRLVSEGMSADALQKKGPYPSEAGGRPRHGEGLWAFWVRVDVHTRMRRSRYRTNSYLKSGRSIMDIRGGAGGAYGLYGEERPANSNFGSEASTMTALPAGHKSRDVRNLGKDNFFRGYNKTDVSPSHVGPSNPVKPRADVWNIFQFKCLGGDKIALYSQGAQMPFDPSNTLSQSFESLYSAAIFMDKDQTSNGYWNAPSITSKPSNLTKSGVYQLEFPHNTFKNYSTGDTGIIGTIKPHGFPGKAIVLNGFKVSGSGWTIGCLHNSRVVGLVVPSEVPRLNKRTVSGNVYNREYRSFF